MLKCNTMTNEFLTKFNSIMGIDPNNKNYIKSLYFLDEFHQATEERLLQKKEIRKQERKTDRLFLLELILYSVMLVIMFIIYVLLHSIYYYK